VTVNVLSASSETYTDALNAVGPLTGNTNGANGIIFLGNSGTPDNAFINVSTGNCFGAQQGAVFSVNGFKVASGGSGVSGNGLFASINSYINYQNIDFGACGGSHRYASHNSFMQAGGNCSISGNAVYSMQSAPSGNIEENGTVTVVGTPAFSGAYAYASRNGVIEANHAGVTYVNPSNATGVQYDVENGGVINTGGASLSGYFPGSTAGVGTNFGTSPYGLII